MSYFTKAAEEPVNIYDRALKHYGVENQCDVAIEEMSELTKELIKRRRGHHNSEKIAEEIADVEIMLTQLKIAFSLHVPVEREKHLKLERLVERMEKGL